MLPRQLDRETLAILQKLIEGNFTGRDELQAAADSLDDRDLKGICRRLSRQLADHAIELQQLVTASGAVPAEPLNVDLLATALFDLTKANRGEAGVIRAAAEGEHNLKTEYDRAIEDTAEADAKALLDRQRREVEFGEQVLRHLKGTDEL